MYAFELASLHKKSDFLEDVSCKTYTFDVQNVIFLGFKLKKSKSLKTSEGVWAFECKVGGVDEASAFLNLFNFFNLRNVAKQRTYHLEFSFGYLVW